MHPDRRSQRAFDTHGSGSFLPQEVLEIPASQKLQDDVSRMLVEGDPDEVHDVGMVELAHYEGLHHEVSLGLGGRRSRGQSFDGHW